MNENEELNVSGVPRALEMKSKLFGFELPDLLFIFMNLAITNLIFGSTRFRYPLVWGTTLGIAALLYFSKRGKPDSYLQHLGEFIAKPSHYSPGEPDSHYRNYRSNSAEKEIPHNE